MLTYEENVKAVLECIFAGYKEELIEDACEKICALKCSEKQEHVLDKIRAEIEAKCCITVGRENDGAITLHDVFEIIDKYKAESEVNNEKLSTDED